jgi:hypothetical protein
MSTPSSLVARIMKLAKMNTLAATVLTTLPADRAEEVITRLEELKIKKNYIACIWTHMCESEASAFIEMVVGLDARPTSCARGCDWSIKQVDESHIFGELKLPADHLCAMADCESTASLSCSRCYLVKYCTPLCQRLDWPRHKSECKKTLAALALAAKYGKEYTRRAFKNSLAISDTQFDRLWDKYHGSRPTRD